MSIKLPMSLSVCLSLSIIRPKYISCASPFVPDRGSRDHAQQSGSMGFFSVMRRNIWQGGTSKVDK